MIVATALLALGPPGLLPRAADLPSVPETSMPGADTPILHSDRSITFALKAPDAHTVQVAGGDGLGPGPFTMTKGPDGLWTVTTPPAVPGFHYYWFLLDGVRVNDPASRTYVGYGMETSGIEVPEAGADYYAITNVPHGEVRERWYFSRTTSQWRRAIVYTPPGYDTDPKSRYPVLLLQHGSGEDESGWTRQGKAQFILDNLIAAGKARPMIVVMDRGYAAKTGAPIAGVGPKITLERTRSAFSTFEDVVIHDLIPTIDASYRTLADREHRAMAGLSMGGMQTLFITLHHPDTFAYVASFSGPIIPNMSGEQTVEAGMREPFDAKTAYEGAFANAAQVNNTFRLLWLGVGTEEPEPFLNSIRSAVHSLKASRVKLVYFESGGTAHEWQTWRRDLNDLAPRLFR